MNYNRIVKFQRVSNFRDIGGFKTEEGRAMKTGVLFRSDELSRLSFSDQKTLRRLNLKLICDLRTPNERVRTLDRIPKKFEMRLVNIPIYPHRKDLSRLKFVHFLNSKSDGYDFKNLIKEYYRSFAFEHTEKINQIVTLLSDENNLPALIHCSVGKDRTGFISSLIQLLA